MSRVDIDSYHQMLAEAGFPYFVPDEICPRNATGERRRRRDIPYLGDEENILPTLRLAVELRSRVGLPMNVIAACRKTGGAPGSKHITNCALDLDLISSVRTRENYAMFWDECARLFKLYGDSYKMGMGHYQNSPYRVHIDTFSRARRVSWYHGPGGVKHKRTIAVYGASAAV